MNVEDYEEWYETPFGRYAHSLEKKLVEKFIKKEGMILDAGCGPGIYTALLFKRGAKVVGLDISEQMIDTARRKCGAPFVVANMERLPFKDKSFSQTLSVLSLCFVSSPSQALEEMECGIMGKHALCFLFSPLLSFSHF